MMRFVAALLLGFSARDSGSIRTIRQFAHKTWSVQDGAPAEIRLLAQSGDGYLWLGTPAGLVRFDGVQFVPFRPRGNDTLPVAGVRSLTTGRDGTLWVVWETGGVSHLIDGRLTTYGVKDGLAPTFQLAESSTGEMVAGTERGLARLTNGKWKDVASDWGFSGTVARALWFDRSDALWVETADRIVYRPARAPRFLDPGWRLKRVAYEGKFAQTTDGTIWFAEADRSVHTLPTVGDTAPVAEVMVGATSTLIDHNGSLWIATHGDGLRRVPDAARIRGRIVQQFGPEAEQFTEKDGLLSNVAWDVFEDREGDIWVASDRGLERFREGSLVPYQTRGGFRPRSVFAARDSSVWIAAFATKEITRIGPHGRDDVHEPPCWCYRLAQDSTGDVWGFEDTMVVRFHGLKPARVWLKGPPLLSPDAVAIDSSGTVWLIDQALGLARISGDRVVPVLPPPATGRFFGLFSDGNQRIWVGGLGRVILYDHDKQIVFGPAEGVRAGQITDFYRDHAGTIWAVGVDGIHKLEGGRFRTLSEKQDLPGRAVFGITEDNTGAWWLATRAGLLRVASDELQRAFADSTHILRYRLFDRLDGLPGVIGLSKMKVLTRAADGRIWVGADEGVAYIDPRDLVVNRLPPKLVVEAVRANGNELDPSDTTIPARSSAVEIDYTAMTLSFPERVQFRYQLEGVDPAWQDAGTRRRAYYAGLRPGSYTFRLQANSGDGNWIEGGVHRPLRVLPAWYQTYWFRALMILLIGSVGGLAVAVVQRRRHLLQQMELKRKFDIALAERVRIAEDLHDTLLQGFAGVNLQLIAAEMAIPTQPELAAATLVRVQRLTEESLREARERVWEMRDAALAGDDLPSALEAIAIDRTAGLAIQVDVTTSGDARRLPSRVEDAVFRTGREAIVNVVRHAGASQIEIHLGYEPRKFCLQVTDNGRGMSASDAAAARKHGHFGLSGIQSRAALLGGHCEILPRPGGGTIVALELPLTQT